VNTFAFLAKAARERPDAPALVWGAERHTYADFRDRALAVGGGLRALGLEPGDRVAFALANSPRVLEVVFGCFAAGLVVVPINARLHPREMAYIVESSGARALVHGPEFEDGVVEHVAPIAALAHRFCADGTASAAPAYEVLLDPATALAQHHQADPTDVAWLFYTSGTTGRPKGATWTHRTIRTVVMNYLADVHGIQRGDVVIHAAPMSHGSGIVALPAVARGATNVILDTASFDPRVLFQLIQDHRASHVAFLAPTQIVRCLEEHEPGAYDLSSLVSICYGGAPMYVEHLRRAVEAFGPVFDQIYGQGEAPITITGLPASEHVALLEADDPRIGSVGRIRTDVEAAVVDGDDRQLGPGEAGEVVVRGDVVMVGYWQDPEATAEALRGGWLHTGDIGYFDDDGYLFLMDRAKDVVITGGNNVYPREVEEVLLAHPDVAMAVVFGIPDDYWGEAVHAVVVREPGADALTAEDLIAWCADHVAGYKKPKAIDFVAELPVSGYGKVLRREVREPYWAGRAGRIGGGASAGTTNPQI
jgi:long-chain acyl-CoA synthetase